MRMKHRYAFQKWYARLEWFWRYSWWGFITKVLIGFVVVWLLIYGIFLALGLYYGR